MKIKKKKKKPSQCWCHYCWLVMSRCVCFLFVCLCFCACVYFWICRLECWISHFIWLLSELSDNVQGKLLPPKNDFIFSLDECFLLFLFYSSLKKNAYNKDVTISKPALSKLFSTLVIHYRHKVQYTEWHFSSKICYFQFILKICITSQIKLQCNPVAKFHLCTHCNRAIAKLKVLQVVDFLW